ncbi:copper resistance protein CopC [Caballeronia terrestris]|uniref:Copper resistance protein CopC n=1 Tax=Caballeronia terrestris TaxID=1226301 RepID=A0A158HPX3_9BURK|nr:copper homeostasis periplasmic binding protein CopC [Caballeronia terrestris]SAL45730.1 copper resistance protein CopC [Caballeronia terrestris]
MKTQVLRGALAASLIVAAPFAFAHAVPKHQVPAADSTVSAPHEVAIDFGEALEPSFSKLDVTDAAGKPVTAAKSAVDASDKKHMSVALGDLAPGTYRVSWTAVAADGHRTQGHYNFKVK